MKKIILVRHGKAEEGASGITDFERSLTLKGKIVSAQMGRKLREIEKARVTLITSPAFRAMETALIFAVEMGVATDKIIINSNIYHKMNLRNLSEMVSEAGEKCDTVILFGHNPSFTEIANNLSIEGCDFMPKSGIAGITFDITSWAGISHKKGHLEYFLKPEQS